VISLPLVAPLLEVRRFSQARCQLPSFVSSFRILMHRGFFGVTDQRFGWNHSKMDMSRFYVDGAFVCPFAFLLI
jgi:hypothetical protein